MAATKKQTRSRFLVKSGTVFTGRVESETKTNIVLDVGKPTRSIVTLDKSYVIERDGIPYPPKKVAKKRKASEALVLDDPGTFSNSPLLVVLFFDRPLPGKTRDRIFERVPAPLRFNLEWVTPEILFAGTDQYFELDVRIAYNAKARALFTKQKIAPFATNRYDVLVDGGIDNEPSDAEMRAFGRDIMGLVAAAHASRQLAVAFVSFSAGTGFGNLEKAAKAHPEEARRAATLALTSAWRARKGKPAGNLLFQNMSYIVLAAIAHERLSLSDEERATLATLFEQIAGVIKLDPTWRKLRAELIGKRGSSR